MEIPPTPGLEAILHSIPRSSPLAALPVVREDRAQVAAILEAMVGAPGEVAVRPMEVVEAQVVLPDILETVALVVQAQQLTTTVHRAVPVQAAAVVARAAAWPVLGKVAAAV